jgi:hypothetical protein
VSPDDTHRLPECLRYSLKFIWLKIRVWVHDFDRNTREGLGLNVVEVIK